MAALRGTGSVLPFVERLNNKHELLGPVAIGLLGGLAQTTWAPSVISVVAFALLFAALTLSTTRGAFARGFVAVFVMVALSRSFVVEAATLYFGSSVPGVLALLGVAVLHGVVFGAACALARALGERARPGASTSATLGFAVVLATLGEMFVPLPLPYPLGMSLAGVDLVARGASVFGVHGLSAAAYAASAAIASVFVRDRPRALAWLGPGMIIVVVLGGVAADVADDPHASAATMRLRLWGGARVHGEAPTWSAPAQDVELTVLPESLFPETLASDDVASLVHGLAGEAHGPLLFATNVMADGRAKNRAFLVAGGGHPLGVSDKRVLIPLAEGPLASLVSRGDSPNDSLTVDTTRIATTICYESLFPMETRERIREHDASVHVNLANDGWFADARPIEAQVRALRLRAIENGVTTVRVSNQGTSVVFLADGTTFWRGGPGATETLDVPIEPRRTIFSRLGSIPVLLLLALMTAAGPLARFMARFRAASCTPS